jgi:anti-anti-sigma factor
MKSIRQEIRYQTVGDVLVIRLKGRILQEVSEELLSFLESFDRVAELKVVVNLSEVHYMSSSAIGALVRIGSESKLKLAELSEVVRKLLELGEILPLFDIAASEDLAVKEFSAA